MNNMDFEKEPFLRDNEASRDEQLTAKSLESLRARLWLALHVVLIATYTGVFMWSTRETCAFQTSLHPINHLEVAAAPKPYDDFEKSPYAGLPTSSIDAAWHYMLEPTTIRVTPEELRRSNQTSVPLPGGGYMAWLGVFHELHCIKMVRQWVYRDHYYPNITEDEFEESSIHADHCLDILRSATLCHGDTTLTTFGWTHKSKPQLNTRPINHKCVDWNQLIASVEDRVVRREEMEGMINPNL